MADFLDFDSLEMEANEDVNGAKEHPLKELSASVKLAYVGGLLFACHADDNELQKEEKSHIVGVARSLGVGKEEVNEQAEIIEGLSDKIGYLKEIVAAMKDRRTILFFLLDTIKAMGADGDLNENAQKLLDGIGKLAKLKSEDVEIVRSYGAMLVGKNTYEGSDLLLNIGNISRTGVAKDLYDWFAPEAFKTLKSEQIENMKAQEVKRKALEKKVKASEKKSLAVEKKVGGKKGASVSSHVPEVTKPRISFDDILKSAFQKFVNDHPNGAMQNNLYIGNSAPYKKYTNARASMNVLEPDFVFQFDNTMWGGAKEGIVITTGAIYYKNIMEDPVRVAWGSVQADSWTSGSDMYLNGEKVELTMMGEETAEAFANLLNSLVEKLKDVEQTNAEQCDGSHPLLAEKNMTTEEKKSYVEGCLMATFGGDARISADDVRRIGMSLGLTAAQVDECFAMPERLNEASGDVQDSYLEGIKSILTDPVVVKYYMADVKQA